MTRRNRLLLALAALAVAAAAGWALRPRAVAVETAPVTRGAFEQAVSEDGMTRVRDRYVVSAPLAGRIERVQLEPGDRVQRGQVVALLTPAAPGFVDARTARELQERIGAAEAQLARARAETARMRAQRDQARADYDRQTRLSKEGFLSPTALEQAALSLQTGERAAEAARFAEDAAGHDYAQAKAALTRYRSGAPGEVWPVTSPVDGSVLRVAQKSEGAVALGAPLLEIADARSLEAVVDVLSQEAVAIRPGMPARVELGAGVAPLAARVRLVEPAAFTKISALGVEEQRVNVVLDFTEDLARVQTVGDGFRIEAQIVTQRVADALLAPVGALFRDGDGWAVFVADGGRARKRAVAVERRNARHAVVQGLAAGERVVVYPSDALRDGGRIVAQPAAR